MTYRQIVRLIIVVALIQLGIVLIALAAGGYIGDKRSCERQTPVRAAMTAHGWHIPRLDCGSFPLPGE